MYIPALGAGVLILGFYIIFLHFFVNQPPVLRSDAVFHIGCYDPSYTNNHSLELSRKLMEIDEKTNGQVKLNMYHSRALSPAFEEEVHELAITFDEYINNYYKNKVRNERDLHYYNSLQLAKRDFEVCAKDQSLNWQECLNDWKNYQGSIDSFASMKKQLSNLIEDKEAQQRRISAVILEHPEEDQTEIEKKYTTKINQLKIKLADSEEKIVDFKTKKGKLWQQIQAQQKNLQEIKILLNQCVTNKELIQFCKNINAELYKFKESVPRRNKNTLQMRLNQKRKIIDGLQLNLRKIQKYGTLKEIQQAQKELIIQKRQLTLLEVQVSNFDTTEQSKCAKCSEDKIAELRKNITMMTQSLEEMKKSYVDFSDKLAGAQNDMNQYKGDITTAQQAREAEINTKFCVDEKCKQQQKQNLLRLAGALNELKKQIIDKQIEINFMVNNQNKKLQSMNKYLPQIEQATDCLLKKDFYEQLKTKAPQKTDISENMVGFRDKVMKKLNDFEL